MKFAQPTLITSVLLVAMFLPPKSAHANDFPTQARVEYVLQCMKKEGGQTYQNLYGCVCAVDRIAKKLSYDEYETASIYAELRRTPGERGSMFRDNDTARELTKKLQEIDGAARKSCLMKPPPS